MADPVTRTVLVVDDDDGVRDLLTDIFRHAGYGVVAASNGREALSQLDVVVPDLIVSDCRMPIMGGDELFRLVKADRRTRHVPYIVVSGADDVQVKEQIFRGFIDAFITKPFDAASVLRAADHFLRTIRVVLAEGDDDVREMASLGLAAQGFDVVRAARGADVLRAIDERNVDVLFLDLDLTDPPVVPLLKAVRGGRAGDVTVLLTSAVECLDSIDPELQDEIDGFVAKPYDVGEVAVRIRLEIGRRAL